MPHQRERFPERLVFERYWPEDVVDRIRLSLFQLGIHPYDLIRTGRATQRLAFWEDWQGLSSNALTGRYIIEGWANGVVALAGASGTGRPYLELIPDITTGGYLQLRLGNILPTLPGPGIRQQVRASENPWFKTLLDYSTSPVGGTQDDYSGFTESVTTGLRQGIYFRVTNNNGWQLVCRDASGETTLASPVNAGNAGTTACFEFRVSQDGGLVQGFVDSRTMGGITTNIPTAALLIVPLAHDNRAAAVTTAGIPQCFGWGMKADLRA